MRSFSLFSLVCWVFWAATFFAILRQTVLWDGLAVAIALTLVLGGALGAVRPARPEVRLRPFFSTVGTTLGVCIAGLLAGVATDFVLAVRDFGGGRVEYTNLSGASAKRRLRGAWPAKINPKTVTSVSYANEWAMDSDSTWWRVEIKTLAGRRFPQVDPFPRRKVD